MQYPSTPKSSKLISRPEGSGISLREPFQPRTNLATALSYIQVLEFLAQKTLSPSLILGKKRALGKFFLPKIELQENKI